MTDGRPGLGWGDGLLIGTIGFALLVTLVGLSSIEAPWLTFLLSSTFILYFLTAIIMLVLVGVFISFEEGKATAYEVAIIAMLSAASIALRVAFAALPQVQPSTFIILAAGVVYGSRAGFMVGALTPLVSNFFLGHGLWTPFQMFAWGAAGASAGLVARAWPDISRNGLIVLGVVWGFLFGWITNLSQLFFVPVTWQSVITIYALSFWFELVHAITNVVIALIFAVEVLWVLRRYRTRFEVEYLDTSTGVSDAAPD
ncbi:MAG: ECF transporter S component [Thermoplasmata archaeon]|nr:ECF transporter S component [Thermoplasmata archaeon]